MAYSSCTENTKSLVLARMDEQKRDDRIAEPKIDKEFINQMDESSLRQTIENLRIILYQASQNTDFSNPSVIAISQELDEYIVRFQQLTNPLKRKETIQ